MKEYSAAERANKERVEAILTPCVGTRKRVRFFYGSVVDGRDWADENDVSGYIGRSIGREPCLLLLGNSRSIGGMAILTHCILRLIIDSREVYRHPLYQPIQWECKDVDPKYAWCACGACDGEWVFAVHSLAGNRCEPLPFEVWRDGSIHARFRSAAARDRWLQYMSGRRMAR